MGFLPFWAHRGSHTVDKQKQCVLEARLGCPLFHGVCLGSPSLPPSFLCALTAPASLPQHRLHLAMGTVWLAGKGRYCRQADLVSVLMLLLDRCAILDLTGLLNCLSLCKMRMLRTYFRGVMKKGGCHRGECLELLGEACAVGVSKNFFGSNPSVR